MSFFITCCLILFIYPAISSINNLQNQIFMSKFHFSQIVASRLTSIYLYFPLIAGPFLGMIVDKCGHYHIFLLISVFLNILGLVYYKSLPDCDQCYTGIPAIIMFGLAYIFMVTSIWPIIPAVVNK